MKICIIGLGARGEKYLNVILNQDYFKLVAVCDLRPSQYENKLKEKGVLKFNSVEDLLKSDVKPDVAIVALPHTCYLPVIEQLVKARIHIIKEKPFATDLKEANKIITLLQDTTVRMMVTTQRRFDLIYQCVSPLLAQIGKIYSIEGSYLQNIKELNQGWRAHAHAAGGGALLDMGYHFLDLLLWYFGEPKTVFLQKSLGNRGQGYDVEDSVMLTLSYPSSPYLNDDCIGKIYISRTGYKSQEKLLIRGSKGTLKINRKGLWHYNNEGKIKAYLLRETIQCSNLIAAQLQHFNDFLSGKVSALVNDYRTHLSHARLIEAAYRSAELKLPLLLEAVLPQPSQEDYVWPVITNRTRYAVLKQLDQSISIYNRSGIVKEFEDKFAASHHRQYALLTNSGTSALFGMFEGLDLTPHDEIIAPAYTFFATASPLVHFGVKIVFADCLANGNIDPKEIEKKVTPRTKGVIITHMWGLPCEMDEIVAICQKYHLKLLEDCSHAHGALYKGKKVGTFGDAAIWSLQGQKILTGGEGGILLTDDKKIYSRAILQGQYNKRAKESLSPADPLYQFSLTGFGLKLRVHPLAVAIANEQFDSLEQWLLQKRAYAAYIIEALSSVKFLIPPNTTNKLPSWYALVFQYDASLAGVPLEAFVQALHDAGLNHIEHPESTQPIYHLPLFTKPHEAALRWQAASASNVERFPNADQFYQQAIKMPVWALPEDKVIVDKYINGILSVAAHLQKKFIIECSEQPPTQFKASL